MHYIKILPGDKVKIELSPYDLARGTNHFSRTLEAGAVVKVRASVKKICNKCKVIRRKGVVRVLCENTKHKQTARMKEC